MRVKLVILPLIASGTTETVYVALMISKIGKIAKSTAVMNARERSFDATIYSVNTRKFSLDAVLSKVPILNRLWIGLANDAPIIPPTAAIEKILPMMNGGVLCSFATTIMRSYKPDSSMVRPADKRLRKRSIGCLHKNSAPSSTSLWKPFFSVVLSN